jgi:hypothetical protein
MLRKRNTKKRWKGHSGMNVMAGHRLSTTTATYRERMDIWICSHYSLNTTPFLLYILTPAFSLAGLWC